MDLPIESFELYPDGTLNITLKGGDDIVKDKNGNAAILPLDNVKRIFVNQGHWCAEFYQDNEDDQKEYLDREQALSFPIAAESSQDFVSGCTSYKEWLETLPVYSH